IRTDLGQEKRHFRGNRASSLLISLLCCLAGISTVEGVAMPSNIAYERGTNPRLSGELLKGE
ncbi:MAG TPA: hypothetical protein VI412_06245, partial [Tabrizicola sp.]